MSYFPGLSTSLVLSVFLAACIFMALVVVLISYIDMKYDHDRVFVLSYAKIQTAAALMMNQTDPSHIKSTENNIPASSTNQIHGTLIVTKNVIDQSGGSSKKNPSDFRITVHGNNASPSSFPGSSSGTPVKLQMGMYSVTETGPSGYNSTLSGDCSGGMMSVETKKCTVTNTYSKKPVISSGNNSTE
jgi:Prealbumin-like fold domain